MAKLSVFLTTEEESRVSSILADKEVKELTVAELSEISTVLIDTEYNGIAPDCTLSAEAINIISRRAIINGIDFL